MVASEARSRPLRILIGPDQQDWSGHWSVLSIGRAGLSDERDPGKIPVTGTLEIKGGIITPPESIDPAINPVRWNPGVDIYIQARNDANTAWIDTWFSRLKILRAPKRPRTNGNLVLDVGCRIQWGNQSQFEDDRSGIIYGQAEPCNAVAARLIQASGIDAGVNLSTWPYSMDRPVGKRQNSFLEQAADLAYANDWHYLYQDINGTIVDREFALTSGTPIATVTVGQKDIIYEPADGEERPAEVTKVAGTGFALGTIENPSVDIQDETINFNDLSPNSFGEGIAVRTITTESFSTGANPMKSKRVQVFKAEALMFQNPTIPSQLREFSDETETFYFESGKIDPSTARLTQCIRTKLQNGKTLDSNDEVFNMRTIEREQEDISYGADEPMERYQFLKTQAAIVLDENAADPWAAITVEGLDFSWIPHATGKFDRADKTKEPLIRLRSNIDRDLVKPTALSAKTRKYSRNTPNKPFETVFFDAGIDEDPTEFEGTAAYIAPGGPSGVEKDRLFTVADGFGFSEEQMESLAIKHRDLIIGRERSYEIGLAITDALLQAPPLAQINVVDVDGSTYEYLADSLSFEFQAARSEAFCFGIWIDGGYVKTINIAATIPAGKLNTEIIQSSFSVSANIPAGRLTIGLTTGFSIAATIPAGQLNTTIVSSFSISASIPAGQLNTQIQAPILIAASLPAGQLNTAITQTINIAASIPSGQLTTDIALDADPDAAAYIAALAGTYSQAETDAINDFFVGIKADGLYSKAGMMLLLAADTASDGLIWMNNPSVSATNNGASFTARQGFTGNGSNAYIDTGFNPASGANYTLNSASLGVYIRTNVSEDAYDIGAQTSGSSDRNYIASRWGDGNHYAQINDGSGSTWTTASSPDSRGLWLSSRTIAIAKETSRDAVLQDADNSTSDGLTSQNIYVLALNNGGSRAGESSKQVGFVWIGDGLSASEVSNLNARVATLLTAFGANV
ncbi:hypothetical protein Lepto7375DRAFT_1839 [Leptolyngbya sp. PCC 7375]|nr:hypothetical protein Lepto7375DRAFT_1839 [Leptolyngbya sp. PCC 7375]